MHHHQAWFSLCPCHCLCLPLHLCLIPPPSVSLSLSLPISVFLFLSFSLSLFLSHPSVPPYLGSVPPSPSLCFLVTITFLSPGSQHTVAEAPSKAYSAELHSASSVGDGMILLGGCCKDTNVFSCRMALLTLSPLSSLSCLGPLCTLSSPRLICPFQHLHQPWGGVLHAN